MDWLGVTEGLALMIVLAIVLAIVTPLVWLFARRRWLSRQGGMFDCALRARVGGPWVLGVARYSGEDFEWFKAISLALRPSRRFHQTDWSVVAAPRHPNGSEAQWLFQHQMIVGLAPRAGGGNIELAVDPPSITGLLSWLESAAPGTGRYGNTQV